MFSSFLGLSCGKKAESSCHSCGYLTDCHENFDYLSVGIRGAIVCLRDVIHLLFAGKQLVFCSLHSLLEMDKAI